MARKDVQLVIRARDEAKSVLRDITKAIDSFTTSSKDMEKGSKGANTALGRMSVAVEGLKKAVSGLDFEKKLTGEAGKAAKRIDDMGQSLEEAVADIEKLEKTSNDGKASLAAMRTEVEKLEKAFGESKANLKANKTELSGLKSELGKVETAQRRTNSSLETTQKTLARQNESLEKSKATYADLAKQIEAAEKPNKRLVNSFEASERAIARQAEAVERTEAKLASTQAKVERLANSNVELTAKVAASAASFERQGAASKRAGEAFKAQEAAAKAAGKAQAGIDKALDSAKDSATRLEAEIRQNKATFGELEAAAKEARVQLEALEHISLSALTKEITEQRTAAVLAEEEFRGLSAELERLQASTKGVATRELARDIKFAEQAANEAGLKFMLQAEATDRMGAVMREAGNDAASLATKTQKLATVQAQLSQDMQELSNDGLKARNAIRGLEQAYDAASQAAREKAAQSGRVASAQKKELTLTGQLAAAYRNLHRGQRTTLSLMQRVRGEALSLAAAYGGLFAAIQVLKSAVDATQKLEAATARLNVANNGNLGKTGSDLDFVRRNASRLGIEFGVLATEYSKFSIATKNTNLEGEKTRKIFKAVAEAARVNRSSSEEMAGVFTALTQIVSKGAVQMEELRQQLGDRLPGALQLMADGLNVTTAELIKMMEAGTVTADALVPFAEELTKRFGPGLAESLTGTVTQLGRLKNAAFEAMLTFGRGGFVDALGDFAEKLTEVLQSADMQTFLENVSAGVASVLKVLGILADNFQLVAMAATAFVGVKLLPYVLSLRGAVANAGRALVQFNGTLAGTRAAAALAGTSIGGAATAVRGFTAAVKGLLSATGIGLAFVAISTAIGYWATEADTATEALVNHRGLIDKVKNAYESTDGTVEEFRKAVASLDDISLTKLQTNLDKIKESLREAIDDAKEDASSKDSFWTNFFGVQLGSWDVPKEYKDGIENLFFLYENGGVSGDVLKRAVEDLNQEFRNGEGDNAEYAAAMDEAVTKILELAGSAKEGEQAVDALTETSDTAQESLDGLNGKAKETGQTLEEELAEKAEKFNNAMTQIGEKIPEVKAEMDRLAESDAIDKLMQEAIKYASTWGEITAAIVQAGKAKEALANGTPLSADDYAFEYARQAAAGSGSDNEELVRATVAVAKELGIAAKDLLTVFSYETGGTLDKWQKGPTTQWGTHRGLIQWGEPQAAQYGVTAGSSITDQVIAAGKYLANAGIKAGDGLHRIYAAVNTGTPDGGNRSDANNGGAPGTANDKVNQQMADDRARAQGLLDAYGGTVKAVEDLTEAERKAAEERAREAERQAEANRRSQEQTDERLASGEQDIANQQLVNAGKEREAEIQRAIADARKADPDITDEEIARITEQTGRLYDLRNAKDANTTATERAQKAEELVNQILQQRAALEEQLKMAKETGDQEQITTLEGQISALNVELVKAIENARAMWEAVGGQAGATAIAQLDTAKMKAQQFGQSAEENIFTWKKVGDLFMGGLNNAFSTFAQNLAEGKGVMESLRDAFLKFASDFLIQIGQMIVKQMLFNMMKGTSFGNFLGIGVGHTGGRVGASRVGSGNTTRNVNPMVFAGATRYHEGGVVGLRPGEVPIIAEEGERILTEAEQRQAARDKKAMGGNGRDKAPTIANFFDVRSFLESGLNDAGGRDVFLNFVQSNSSEIKAALDT